MVDTIDSFLNEIDTFIEINQKTLLNFLPKNFQGDKKYYLNIEDIQMLMIKNY